MILKEQFTEEYVKAKCLKDDPGQHLQTSVVPWPPSSPDLNKGVYPDISRAEAVWSTGRHHGRYVSSYGRTKSELDARCNSEPDALDTFLCFQTLSHEGDAHKLVAEHSRVIERQQKKPLYMLLVNAFHTTFKACVNVLLNVMFVSSQINCLIV